MARVNTWVMERAGKIYAKLEYVDSKGKRRQLTRTAKNRKHAKQIIEDLKNSIALSGDLRVTEKTLMKDLIAWYREKHVKPAEYWRDRKIAGMKNYKKVLSILKPIETHFSTSRLSAITYTDLEEYKVARLKQKIYSRGKRPRVRSASSINRELEVLKALFNIAVQQKWLRSNPFKDGKTLIQRSHEIIRNRILTPEEEQSLLDQCWDGSKREHLYPYIIVAVDSGMRPAEIHRIKKSDLHFDQRYIYVAPGKTDRPRMASMTERMVNVLKAYTYGLKPNDLVFPHLSYKKSFATACKYAGLHGVSLYTLRHTYATRLAQNGVELAVIARNLGHTSLATTYRYANQDLQSVHLSSSVLNKLHQSKSK